MKDLALVFYWDTMVVMVTGHQAADFHKWGRLRFTAKEEGCTWKGSECDLPCSNWTLILPSPTSLIMERNISMKQRSLLLLPVLLNVKRRERAFYRDRGTGSQVDNFFIVGQVRRRTDLHRHSQWPRHHHGLWRGRVARLSREPALSGRHEDPLFFRVKDRQYLP